MLAILAVSPLLLLSKIGLGCNSEMPFVGCTQLLSLIPDFVGSYLRVAFYTYALPECSFTGHMRFGTFISRPQARIGANFYIGSEQHHRPGAYRQKRSDRKQCQYPVRAATAQF